VAIRSVPLSPPGRRDRRCAVRASTELPSRSPDQIGARAAARVVDPRAHARILPLEQTAVANVRYIVQGMMTATSDHPAVPAKAHGVPAKGIRNHHGTLPLGS